MKHLFSELFYFSIHYFLGVKQQSAAGEPRARRRQSPVGLKRTQFTNPFPVYSQFRITPLAKRAPPLGGWGGHTQNKSGKRGTSVERRAGGNPSTLSAAADRRARLSGGLGDTPPARGSRGIPPLARGRWGRAAPFNKKIYTKLINIQI